MNAISYEIHELGQRSDEDRSAWEQCKKTIQSFVDSPEGWDHEDAPCIDQKLVEATLRLLEETERDENRNGAPTYAYPHVDGSIFVEWRRKDGTRTVLNVFQDEYAIAVYLNKDGQTASERLPIPRPVDYWLPSDYVLSSGDTLAVAA